MTLQNYKRKQKGFILQFPKTMEYNPVESATDPTQDIPVKMIEVTAAGIPINVKETRGVFSNLKAENLTSIERRNNDKFDVMNELQTSIGAVARDGVTTNFVPPKKTQLKHE